MSFSADKKREHEQTAETSLAQKDYAGAFFHTAKAADFGFNLAEQSDGKVARAYLKDANELLDIAAKLKERARGQDKGAPGRIIQENENVSAEEEKALQSSWQLHECPGVRLSDVAGLDEVKAALCDDVINAMSHPEVYERFKVEAGGGVLMYGPPGNGKTFIAKAVAGELDAAFFAVDASQIKNKYVGETEKNMRRLFETARQYERAVIFLDEIDALLQKRGNQKVNAVTQFLILADGIAKTNDCALLLLGATNKPWSIDPAALRPGRFGKQIYVGLPDETAREAIVRFCLKEVPIEDGFSFDEIVSRTDGYSGADMSEICRRAKKAAIRRQIESGESEVVTRHDVEHSLDKMTRSVSSEALAEYEKWRDDHSAGSHGDEDE